MCYNIHTKMLPLCIVISTDDKIERTIAVAEGGTIFFPKDFIDTGSSGAIRVALHRMVKRGVLVRLASGIYAKPRINELLQMEILPEIEKVAMAIAKRDRAKILPTGDYALHVLGLSTQVPLNVVYQTDGRRRKLRIGNRTITFKQASTTTMALRGALSKLAVQALKAIGKEQLKESEAQKIIDLLRKEDITDLKHDIALAPLWIAEIMTKALRS